MAKVLPKPKRKYEQEVHVLCGGTGRANGTDKYRCMGCKGTGWVKKKVHKATGYYAGMW
jgi:DnaJ-class molecular chaperone